VRRTGSQPVEHRFPTSSGNLRGFVSGETGVVPEQRDLGLVVAIELGQDVRLQGRYN
jgi:hypothetical protein